MREPLDPAAPRPWDRVPTLPVGAWGESVTDRLVGSIAHRARAGTPGGERLRRALRWPWHAIIAWALFSLLLLDAANAEARRGYPLAYLALLAVPIGVTLLRRPLWLGVAMALAGTWMRLLYLSAPETCDQLAVSRAALTLVAHATNPWGFGYPESVPPGAPFPYGLLAPVAATLGVPGEVLAMAGILLLLAWSRALLTCAFLAAWVSWIEIGVCGINDQIPAFLLLGGLLLLERRRLAGAALVGLSIGIKPYTFAWVPPLIGFGGPWVAAVLLGVSTLAWLPLLAWGPRSYLDSIELARAVHPIQENALDLPHLRILAVPAAVMALFVRRWSTAVVTGAAIFMLVLFLDRWASFGYWFVVLPPVGIVAERGLRRFSRRLRGAISASGAVVLRPATDAGREPGP